MSNQRYITRPEDLTRHHLRDAHSRATVPGAFRVALGLRRAARRASTTSTRADDARIGDDERILKQKKKFFFIARLIPHQAVGGSNLADEGTPPRRSRSSCPRAF